MQQIDMSKEKPMGIAEKVPRVRCLAVYPTGTRAYASAEDEDYCCDLLW